MKLSVGERQAKIRVLPFTGRGGLSLKRRLVEIFTYKKAAGQGTGGSENPDEAERTLVRRGVRVALDGVLRSIGATGDVMPDRADILTGAAYGVTGRKRDASAGQQSQGQGDACNGLGGHR